MSILAELEQTLVTRSPEEMREAASRFARVLPENSTVELSGDLGAGKTVFVKGMAEAWEISDTVTSPSFTIFSIYRGKRNLLHLDAYRLNSAEEMEPLMIEEFLQPPYCLAVEWPEKIREWLPGRTWKLEFSIEKDGAHAVKLIQRPESAAE